MGSKKKSQMNHTLIMSNALNNLIYGNQKIMDFTNPTREGATDLNRKTSF